jgi:hypothetical protein
MQARMKTIAGVILVFNFLFLLTSCSAKAETLPGTDILLSDMNQDIELLPNPGDELTPKNQDVLILKIRNLSPQEITFPGDYGVKLFYKKADDWIEVENQMRSPEREVILPLANDFPGGAAIAILPCIPDMSQPITLRVAVIGHPENNAQENIGAYVDVLLDP